MDLREKILSTSMNLMMRIGPQSVTMDMVARDCGISKRTLYETFPNKNNLISCVIDYNQQLMNTRFTQIFEQSSNSFEALLGVYTLVRQFIQKMSPVFVSDLKRLYPEVFYQYKEHEEQHMESLAKIIAKAKEEGLALPGIKCKIAAFVFTNNIKSLHYMEELPFTEYSAAEVFDGAFLNFMRGIATREGQDIIENYVVKLLNKDNN